jgi:phosphoribosylanthranilate isomerase
MNEKKGLPYVGVTGFENGFQVNHCLENFANYLLKSQRLFMVGVLVSDSTARGEVNKKWPNRYPEVSNIDDIFTSSNLGLNLIHYHTTNKADYALQLFKLVDLVGGDKLHGFQLNTTWPDPSELEKFLCKYPKMKLVLPITSSCFESVSHNPMELVKKIKDHYLGLINYILLDPSGGKGVSINLEMAEKYLREFENQKFDIGLGLAGGLGPETIMSIKDVVDKFPDVSIDAEGKLRGEDDKLNFDKTLFYITRAFNIF